MLSTLSATTTCWSLDFTICLQMVQTAAHSTAALACLTMPITLYRARQQANTQTIPLLLITSAFALCLGLNQILSVLTLWHEAFVPNGFEILWALTSALICTVASRSLEQNAVELLTTRQELAAIRALAKTDPLTGLENRQGFNSGLKSAIENSQGAEKPSVLMLLDLDGFKEANDTYGHLVGDHILQRVSQILQRHAHRSDCVARLGGDEFAVIWNQCSLETAKSLAESARKDIAKLWLSQAPKDESIVTASIGLAIIDPESSTTGMYELTDRALYVSKREGKNQVSWMPNFKASHTFESVSQTTDTELTLQHPLSPALLAKSLDSNPATCLETNRGAAY
ncbi:MAG: GGDEF domain-containing protein [Cyanobacteria bacterium P01_D01_bin.73]